jgi:hypothetical protein
MPCGEIGKSPPVSWPPERLMFWFAKFCVRIISENKHTHDADKIFVPEQGAKTRFYAD